MTEKVNIGVLGGGAWGTALAQNIAQSERDVVLWAREEEVVKSINESHENVLFLPTIPLSERITATSNLEEASKCDILLVVTPAQFARDLFKSIAPFTKKGQPIVICSKGIEIETGKLLSQVLEEEIPEAICAVMTGPTFATEIAHGKPSAMTLAVKDKDTARALREVLSTKTLRTYITDDVIGVQLAGAVKNVIAIASGIVHGLDFGESARAALVTRGLAEMGRLGSAMGAQKETLMGMCGIGDLMLTASSLQSRNFSLGVLLGEGKTLDEILESRNSVTEGVHTSKALMTLAKNNAVEMPIAEAVYKCLNKNIPINEIIDEILERPLP
ncbi:MAG: NAD(P)-dependent glycerol-3-phosphate dehydrogenase [Alphaproteobacteria bacterium]|nr:NAD(P)-dependent glycerol-3-phosphate dehydrogenase [Alphaproteobacteria bacterium]